MMQIKNLTKIYGLNKVLDNVNLVFEPNKIYGVLGRNGAGKTTLVNIITNRAFATSGIVEIDSDYTYENDKTQEKIFCITEKSAYPMVEKVSALFKWAGCFYPQFDDEYALYLAQLFEIDLNKKLGKLSTGYVTIVKVILTLASNAPYMIFDEPVLGIDAIYREIFYDELKKRHAKLKNTMIICTHILNEIETVIDDAIILKKGRIAFSGPISVITKKCSLNDYYLELYKKSEQSEIQEMEFEKLKPNKSGEIDIKKIKYSLAYLFNITWIQFITIIGILVLFAVFSLVVPDAEPSTEIMLWINLIFVGMSIHGYYFKYALYNGISRRTYFIAIMTMIILCALFFSIMATGVYKMQDGNGLNLATLIWGNLNLVTIFIWLVFTSLLILTFTLFGMVIYQALTRKGRYFAMIILAILIIGLAFWGALAPTSLGNIIGFLGGIKYNLGMWFAIMWIAIFATIFAIISWVILRKTEIK